MLSYIVNTGLSSWYQPLFAKLHFDETLKRTGCWKSCILVNFGKTWEMVDFANPVLHLDLTTMEPNCPFSTDLRKTGVRGSC